MAFTAFSDDYSMKRTITAYNCPNCGASVSPDRPSSCVYCGSKIAVRVCPSCFGAIAAGMKSCPSCGAKAENSSPSDSSLQCPRCETPLSSVLTGHYPVHECKGCGGLWLDKKTFQEICTHEEAQEAVLGCQNQAVGPAVQLKTRRAYIPCPECRKLMNTKNFSGSGIVLDWCRDHGSWFDRGELQKIISFIRNGGLRKARERELEELEERRLDLEFLKFRDFE
jgi:Zn-finger nucleic acid-binding protein